tara:strand:- start:333 stop:437 length:105 start_codon:yes stop_codon:yes gene_type:complete
MGWIIDVLLTAGFIIFVLFVGAIIASKKNQNKDK